MVSRAQKRARNTARKRAGRLANLARLATNAGDVYVNNKGPRTEAKRNELGRGLHPPPRHEGATCQRKQRHATKRAAVDQVRSIKARARASKGGAELRVYHCEFCDGFHIGREKPDHRQRRETHVREDDET